MIEKEYEIDSSGNRFIRINKAEKRKYQLGIDTLFAILANSKKSSEYKYIKAKDEIKAAEEKKRNKRPTPSLMDIRYEWLSWLKIIYLHSYYQNGVHFVPGLNKPNPSSTLVNNITKRCYKIIADALIGVMFRGIDRIIVDDEAIFIPNSSGTYI